MDNKSGILDLTLSKRTDLIKLFLAACILAMGTSLIANFISDYFKTQMIISLFIGGGLILIVALYFILSIISEAEKQIEIEGVIPIENKSNKVFPILRYEFSENLSDTMEAVFLENEALRNYWEENFKSNKPKEDETKKNQTKTGDSAKVEEKEEESGYYAIVRIVADKVDKEKKKGDKLLEEIIEYLVIEQLSTHLSTYFNGYGQQDKLIKEYTRNDFPEILLQNRIVNMLSTPFEDRAIFAKAGMTKNPPKGEIVAIYGKNGSRFTRFDLSLPNGSTVRRPSDGVLTVENNRIFLQIEIHYSGFSTNLPKGFEHNYLGLDSGEINTRILTVLLKYRIKPLALLYRSKWNYHNWVDSFADRMIEYLSFDDFVKSINWNTNLTAIVTGNQRRKILKEKSESEKSITSDNGSNSN